MQEKLMLVIAVTFNPSYISITIVESYKFCDMYTESVREAKELIGGVVGAALSVVGAAIVLLIVLCLCRRYCCTATKKTDL